MSKKVELYVTSEHYFYQREGDFVVVEVNARFSKKDWEEVETEATQLGLEPEGYLEKRFKRAVRPRAKISRIEDASVRRRLYDGHSDYWLPFVRHLIFAHLSVLAGGFVFEWIVETNGRYTLFYWIYVLSLILALFSWMGFKVASVWAGLDENQQMMQTEAWMARAAEYLMWMSLVTFGGALIGRVVLGLRDAGLFELFAS